MEEKGPLSGFLPRFVFFFGYHTGYASVLWGKKKTEVGCGDGKLIWLTIFFLSVSKLDIACTKIT